MRLGVLDPAMPAGRVPLGTSQIQKKPSIPTKPHSMIPIWHWWVVVDVLSAMDA